MGTDPVITDAFGLTRILHRPLARSVSLCAYVQFADTGGLFEVGVACVGRKRMRAHSRGADIGSSCPGSCRPAPLLPPGPPDHPARTGRTRSRSSRDRVKFIQLDFYHVTKPPEVAPAPKTVVIAPFGVSSEIRAFVSRLGHSTATDLARRPPISKTHGSQHAPEFVSDLKSTAAHDQQRYTMRL